jgi:hypothetical protein
MSVCGYVLRMMLRFVLVRDVGCVVVVWLQLQRWCDNGCMNNNVIYVRWMD